MNQIYQRIAKIINSADAIIIGAGAGLSTSAGYTYAGKRFLKNFKYMHDKYGYNDMFSAGFHNFSTLEEYWGYWSKFIYLNRYSDDGLPLYKDLYQLLKDKNYFVLTTNVDHQFQKVGFSKDRLFYSQGDYGLFQCSLPCHNKTYDNEKEIKEMVNNQIDHQISSSLIPICPYCGKPMTMNLRSDNTFVEDESWYKAKDNYIRFIRENQDKKIAYLELGVGFNTPVIIKYPFWELTNKNSKATYISINLNENYAPKEIEKQSILINEDIKEVITNLLEIKENK